MLRYAQTFIYPFEHMLIEGKQNMEYIRVKLTERETNDISKLYGLWEFTTENLNNGITIFVYES